MLSAVNVQLPLRFGWSARLVAPSPSALPGTWVAVALTLSVMATPSLDGQTTPSIRRLRVEDLFTIEELLPAGVRPSPDGEWLAVERSRAPAARGEYQHSLFGWWTERADVWLVPTRGGTPRRLTSGLSDQSAWQPIWSPTGGRLAMLSTEGGGDVRVYAWTRGRDGPVRLTESGVDLQAQFFERDGSPVTWPGGWMAWLDTSRVLTVLRPAHTYRPPLVSDQFLAPRRATAGWAQAVRGVEPTASVLDTDEPDSQPGDVALVMLTVPGRQVDTIALLPFLPKVGRAILLAPDHRSAAIVAVLEPYRPDPALPVRHTDPLGRGRYRLGTVELHRGATINWVAGVSPAFDSYGDWNQLPVQWSPDGRLLALRGTRAEERGPDRAFVVDVATSTAHQVSGVHQMVTAFAWSGSQNLVVQVRQESNVSGNEGSMRADWWAYEFDRSTGTIVVQPVNVTAGLDRVPNTLVPVNAGAALVGIAQGRLWLLTPHGGNPVQLTDTTVGQLADFVNIRDPSAPAGLGRSIVVIGEHGSEQELHRVLVTPKGVELELIPLPHPGATLIADRPTQQLAVFTSGTLDLGPVVWTSDGRSAKATEVLSLNKHLQRIARAERRMMSYVGMDGDSLRALLFLPPGYQPGRPYPLVIWVYGGFSYTDTLQCICNVTDPHPFNVQILAARGYVVLFPSIPLGPEGEGVRSDPYLDIPKGVMGAVDRVVALGIADPARMAVMGHSFGGYTTYALATYTHRFKAAIALAGPADLVSEYGTFEAQLRYETWVHRSMYLPALLEGAQQRMGVPPYADMARYTRNSPLTYADRITTPILIIQGDLDFMGLQQGEEMFTALFRLGKRARYVRYWGEGHTVESPANVRHMWGEIFAWLDRYIGPPDTVTSQSLR
jgi:dipeptidyl aminopeptidase/acylaminoacyl peptidase